MSKYERPPGTIPFYKRPYRTRTDHDLAVACAKKGWGKHDNRKSWEDSLRFKGTFKL